MNVADLREQVEAELENMASTISELSSLVSSLASRDPTLIEKTAAGAFLAQLYGGLENVMKRVCMYHGVSLPAGPNWHGRLFRMFCAPTASGLPNLFDPELDEELSTYRRFRHAFVHGYGVLMDWGRMAEGVRNAPHAFDRALLSIRRYLDSL